MTNTFSNKSSSPKVTQLTYVTNPAFDNATVKLMADKANQFCDACLYNFEDIAGFKDVLFPLDYTSIPYAVTKTREALNLEQSDDISIKQLSYLLFDLGVAPIPVGWGQAGIDGSSPRTSLLLQNNDGAFQWCYINANISETSVKLDLARNIALLLSELPNDERSTKKYLKIAEEFSFQLIMPDKEFVEIYQQIRSKKTKKKRAQAFIDICIGRQFRLADLWVRMSILTTRNRMKPLDCLREVRWLEKQGVFKSSDKPLFSSNDYGELKDLSVDVFGSYFYLFVDKEIENMPIIEQFDFINTLTDMPLMGNIH